MCVGLVSSVVKADLPQFCQTNLYFKSLIVINCIEIFLYKIKIIYQDQWQ